MMGGRLAVATLTMIAGALGCGREPTRPPITSIMMSLAAVPAVGSAATPVKLDLGVRNAGETRVWHCEGCGCGNGTSITVLGPDGHEVLLLDPNAPRPLCPDGPRTMDPSESLTGGGIFTGTLYEETTVYPAPTYSAPPGRYTVIARFTYWADGSYPRTSSQIDRTTTFDWQP